MPHPLLKSEMETIFRTSADSQEWDICTADSRIINYLQKRGWKPVESPDRQFGHPYLRFSVPFRKVRVQTPEKRKASGGGFVKRVVLPQQTAL